MPLSTPSSYLRAAEALPADHGLLAWSWDPVLCNSSGVVFTTAGTVYSTRLWVPQPMKITNLHCMVMTAGATLTASQCLAGLFDSSGNLLSATADQSTAWTSTGFKTMALSTAQNVPQGFVDVAFFYNGTTSPALARAASTTQTLNNLNLSGNSIRFASSATARTTSMPASLGTKTSVTMAYWVGLS
ncbi:MAG: hypothetical protein ACXVYY_01360 [Oryzihumus sp.]